MALTVREIMNPELFTVAPEDPVDDTLASLLALGLSGAPVVDATRRPVGLVSWRDLVKRAPGTRVRERMTAPARTVRESDLIENAARRLAVTGAHHAPVIDEHGATVGFVSSLDLLRGLLGIPAGHPAGFAHFDEETGLVWTDPAVLREDQIPQAPDGAGVIALIHGGRGIPETLVWAESTHSLRARLIDLLSEPQAIPQLARFIGSEDLRFRAAAVADGAVRRRVATELLARARRAAWLERLGP